jgi:hypothetical protein
MRIYSYDDYSRALDLSNHFMKNITTDIILESDEETEEDDNFLSKLTKDLKLNTALILSFGTCMELLIPIVKKLCENGEFQIELTPHNLALMTLTAVTVAYLEEEKEKGKKEKLEKDSKSMLEELKLRGIGNGIIKKLVKALMSIGYISKLIFQHKKNIVASFFEMLGYASLYVPVLNGIKAIIGDYNLTLDNFSNNIASLLLGLASLSAKHILNMLTKATKKEDDEKKTDIIDSTYDTEGREKLIREQ